MRSTSNRIIGDFDFTEALKLTPLDRLRSAVSLAQRRLADQGALGYFMIPPIPDRGVTDAELRALQLSVRVDLPEEYAQFLRCWRYLIVNDGLQIWGLDHEGVSIGWPWLSDQHLAGHRYLVFGH
jgi:hypothetical protein